jgi:hypothetical protein
MNAIAHRRPAALLLARRLRRLLIGFVLALGLLEWSGLAAITALALTLEEAVERFERCGHTVGDHQTVYSLDGASTTSFRVWAEDHRGVRGLVVYVYADQDTADGVFHALAVVERLEGLDPAPDNGPLLERGAGRSIWRENVAVAQIMPMAEPSDLDVVPDADLIQCLDGAPEP